MFSSKCFILLFEVSQGGGFSLIILNKVGEAGGRVELVRITEIVPPQSFKNKTPYH